jgi:hypothetical protein
MKTSDNNCIGGLNLFDDIMAYEGGELDEYSTIELFQNLVNNGMAWSLQGHYGRTAKNLIDAGLVILPNSNAPPLRRLRSRGTTEND